MKDLSLNTSFFAASIVHILHLNHDVIDNKILKYLKKVYLFTVVKILSYSSYILR